MINKKIKVNYVCGAIGEPNVGMVWGGTMATNYTIKKAFANSKEVQLNINREVILKTYMMLKNF